MQGDSRLFSRSLMPKGYKISASFFEFYEEFVKLYPIVKAEVLAGVDESVSDVLYNQVEKSMHYNIITKNSYTVFPVYTAYQYLVSPEERTLENIRLANILDWCLELVLSGYLIIDDIMDKSKKRSNKTCWYCKGSSAISDSKIMQIASYKLLRKYFHNMPYYGTLLNMVSKTFFMCNLGQSLDALVGNQYKKTRNFKDFTFNKQKMCVAYKTNYFACKLPINVALLLANSIRNEKKEEMDKIFTLMSQIVQAQNDIWDCYARNDIYGKDGNDITEGKLTWLIVTAIESASRAQLNLLQDNYGRQKQECYEMVKNVYKDLNILNKYLTFGDELVQEMYHNIRKLPNIPLKHLLSVCIRYLTAQDNNMLHSRRVVQSRLNVSEVLH
ncbi:hypothetical protein RI129_001021 [Pyrocoelia pectoralis]|uniref:Farnesyl pyrophosphate synthase n=1 Tax=Pyrocoelia pectoralis TaxID=417401 RepID=A0AAN7VJZ8_9COLE